MDVPSEEFQCVVLLGALCLGGAIVEFAFGMRRRAVPWPKYVASMSIAFAVLAVFTTVSVSWIGWIDYDRGIRASVESAKEKGYEIRRSERSDGTVVYQARNYVITDGSFSIIANRSPFRPRWSFVASCSLLCGVVAAFFSFAAQVVTRRYASEIPVL
jgi:hypothetical protein